MRRGTKRTKSEVNEILYLSEILPNLSRLPGDFLKIIVVIVSG